MPEHRILVVTNGHLCRNPRALKEAMALGNAGHTVTVLSVRNHPRSIAIDTELLRGTPLHHEVIEEVQTSPVRRLAARLSRQLARVAVRSMGWQTPRALGPFSQTLRQARSLNADLTIVHNEVPHCVGVRLIEQGRRVAADIEDWHSEDLLPADRRHRPLGLLRATERALLHRAVYTTTTSHALAAALHARHGGRRPEVITNSFPLPPLATRHPDAVPSFFWFSQTIGPGRGLEPFLAAWAGVAERSRVVLLGEVNPAFRTQLISRVPLERRGDLEFLPLVPPGELPAVIARHDIGLALEESSIPSRDLTITNKILQYLGAGLAVVASDTAGQREVLRHDSAAGVIVPLADTAAFTGMLNGMLADRTQLAARQAAARRLAETTYCWERESPRLLGLVEAALATST